MKYGMNLLLWTGQMTDDMVHVVESLKQMGFDGVEIPVMNTQIDYTIWQHRLDALELERTAVVVREETENPISTNPTVRQRGIDCNKRAVDCCAQMGATQLVGPFHSAIGVFTGDGPTDHEWKLGVDGMRQVAEHASRLNVILGVECLNRFENYLLNTHADVARFVKEVDHSYCRMIYDSFHANIEEKSVSDAIRVAANLLCEVHISENDRSTPGQGDVRWNETFDVLREVGYDGWLTIEAFGQALPELVAATKIWRRMYESEEQLARDGLAFMKAQVAQRWH